MNEETALLAAIAEGDDAARLAYADLLEERGDARAAWVRDVRVWRWMEPDARDPLPGLFAALSHADKDARESAVAALAVVGAAAAVPELVRIIEAGEADIGADASPDWPELGSLIESRREPTPAACAAAEALARMPAEAVEPVIPALLELAADESYALRSCAVVAMRGVGAAALPALPALVAALDGWQQADEAAKAATAILVQIGPDAASAVPRLLEVGTDFHYAQEAVGSALAVIAAGDAWRLFGCLADFDDRARVYWLADTLREMGPDVVPQLRSAFGGEPSGHVRRLIALVLAPHHPDEVLPELLDGLDEWAGVDEVRDIPFAEAILGAGRAAGAEARLSELLPRLGWHAKELVLRALSAFGSGPAIRDELLRAVEFGDAGGRDSAVRTLAHLGGVPDRLVPAVASCPVEHRDTQSAVERLLGGAGRDAVREQLSAIVRSADEHVASTAIREIVDSQEGEAALLACLDDERIRVRSAAVAALAGSARTDVFVAMARDADAGLHVEAAMRLGDSGPLTPESAAAIRDLLGNDDFRGEIQTAAMRAVAIRGPAACGLARPPELSGYGGPRCWLLTCLHEFDLSPSELVNHLREHLANYVDGERPWEWDVYDLPGDDYHPASAAYSLAVVARMHGGDVARDAVPELLRHAVAPETIDAFAAIGRPAVPALVGALSSPESSVRENVAHAIARIGGDVPEVIPRLRRMLWAERDAEVEAAMVALAAVGATAARDDLARMAGGERLPAVALWAASRLGGGVSHLRRGLESADGTVRALAAVELSLVGEGDAPPLDAYFAASAVAAAHDELLADLSRRNFPDVLARAARLGPDTGDARHAFAFKVIGRFGDRDPEAAVAAVAGAKYSYHVESLRALERVGSGSRLAHAEILKRMHDGGPETRAAGVAALRAWLTAS